MESERPDESSCLGVEPLSEAQITLELPSEKYIDSFFEAAVEFIDEGQRQTPEGMSQEQFPGYVQRLHDQAAGKNLKDGHIPSKEFWMIDQDGFAGRIILGLAYMPAPDRVGHHVGYAVRPSKRRKGYATQALRLLLNEARKLNIYKLMPSCGADNVASRKVIEKNGGALLERIPEDEHRPNELRFIIDLEAVRS